MKIIIIEAIWCPGCLVMKKVWNKINEEYNLDIVKLDYDIDNQEVVKLNVGNILPVVIFQDDKGNELDRIIGETSFKKIKQYINKYMEVK